MAPELLTAVIVATITAGGTIICQLLINKSSQNVVLYRIGELEKKQDKYNNLQERVYNLEKAQALNDEILELTNKRLDKMEKGD